MAHCRGKLPDGFDVPIHDADQRAITQLFRHSGGHAAVLLFTTIPPCTSSG